MAKIVETPLMKQYFEIKAQNPDAILLFRVGDFYEMYGKDAVVGAEISYRPSGRMEQVYL